ncbi:MAG: beta-galactosidase [Kiritimatiellae bacterium]|nr:beta-galactosidase [Kiritimatiellia bacterium]
MMGMLLSSLVLGTALVNPLDTRWTFGAHEPYTMYRRVGRHCTGGIDGNAEWVKPWLDWWDAEAPKLMKELGLNGLHSRFYKGMGWEEEKKDFPNVKKFVANCHANGVMALAYVQFATLYPDIMRAEIPDVDSWQQVAADGKPNLYYGQYFRTLPCVNCEAWEAYIKRMCTIALTEGGFDGIMFDNSFSKPCFCARCQRKFTAYLQAQPNKEHRFGFANLDHISLPKLPTKASYVNCEVQDPVVQAWIRWRTETLTAVFRRLRDHIKSVKADAVVSANALPFRMSSGPSESSVDMVDLAEVYDLIIGQTGNYPSFKNNVLTCRIRELKLAREMGKPIVALCDSDSKLTPEQEAHYLLPLYEDLVFGGIPTDRTVVSPKAVPGFIDRAKVARRKPMLKAFNDFVAANRASLTAPVYAPIRLFYPVKEMQFSKVASDGLCAAEEILTRRQMPWEYIISRPGHELEVPAGTEVIVVANQVALSMAQVEALIAWAKKGGKLVVTGDSGRYNEFNGQRLENPLLKGVAGLKNVVVRTKPDVVAPCSLSWTYKIGAPKDHGQKLLADLAATGFRLPFEVRGCPESVAVDVRKSAAGFVFHLVNFDPAHSVKGATIALDDGRVLAVPELAEYALVQSR